MIKNTTTDLVYLPQSDTESRSNGRRLAERLGYKDCYGLKFSLRSVEKFAPWINNIFIIVKDTVPQWLDISNPKIKVLQYSDFVDFEFLNTTDSENIVFHLHKIESLSEDFLLADENMYFGSPVKKSDFFTKNGGIVGRCIKLQHTQKELSMGNSYFARLKDETEKKRAYTNSVFYYKTGIIPNFTNSPNIQSCKKSLIKNCISEYEDIIYRTLLQNNEAGCLLSADIFSFYAHYKKLLKIKYYKKTECITLYTGNKDTNQNPKICIEKTPKLFSVYPTENVHARHLELTEQTLKKLFPFSSSFEKDYLIHICFSTNNEFTKHCAAAIVSIIENCMNKPRLRFYVLHNNLSAKNKEMLKKTVKKYGCDVEILCINFEDFKDCQVEKNSHFTVETYFRLKIPDLINHADKIIYIDCDTTMLGNIEELWDTELGSNYLAACQDVTQPKHLKEEMGDDIYFNAGVLVINAKLWRTDNLGKILFDFMSDKPDKILWVDQDALNGVLHGRVKLLSSVWNVMYNPYFDILSELYDISEIKLIHNVSRQKPWNMTSKHKYAKYYFKYLAKTAWMPLAYIIPVKLTFKRIFGFVYDYQSNKRIVEEFQESLKDRKVLLWGASIFISKIIRFYGLKTDNIKGIVDKDINKQGKKIGKYKIYNTEDLKNLDSDLIVCSVINHPRMGEYINKELNRQNLKIEVWENCFERLKDRV